MRTFIAALTVVAAFAVPLCAQSSGGLSVVKKIHVGSMGQSDEAERFRMLLEEELSKAGFVAVPNAEEADGILTGVLAVRVYSDESLARVTVALKSADGHRIWGKD